MKTLMKRRGAWRATISSDGALIVAVFSTMTGALTWLRYEAGSELQDVLTDLS
jgi:hypothetical protein